MSLLSQLLMSKKIRNILAKYARNEEQLQTALIYSPPIPYTQLKECEWMIEHSHPQYGVGDVVFKLPGFEDYLVVETKYMTNKTGKTARSRRGQGRKKVQEQAEFYGRRWKQLHPEADVSYAWFTNDRGLSRIVWIPPP